MNKKTIRLKYNLNTKKKNNSLLTYATKIRKNEYHIPEPVDGLEVPVSKNDVIFVPLLAFDTNGNRVGYGKGFYDLFLAASKPGTLKIGLSFFEAEPKIEDVFEFDQQLHYCVTPNKIYTFVHENV